MILKIRAGGRRIGDGVTNFSSVNSAKSPPETVIVDVGAGKGQYRKPLRRGRYIGVDFVAYDGVAIVTDIVAGLPLPDESADVVVLSNVLEHIPEPRAVLAHCHRILRPGGKVLILVPFFIKIHQEPYDYLRYTHFMLRYVLGREGFEKVRVDPSGNIVDVMQKVETGFFRTAKASVRYRSRSASRILRVDLLLKALGYAYVAALRIVARGIFFATRAVTDPALRTGKDWYAEGYGAVGYKRAENGK